MKHRRQQRIQVEVDVLHQPDRRRRQPDQPSLPVVRICRGRKILTQHRDDRTDAVRVIVLLQRLGVDRERVGGGRSRELMVGAGTAAAASAVSAAASAGS